MVLCDMVKYTACGGVVWYGVVWCGVVWCGVVWCGVVWCGAVVQRGAVGVWYGIVLLRGIVWCDYKLGDHINACFFSSRGSWASLQ